MLSEKLSYYVLSPLAHRGNLATEGELDARNDGLSDLAPFIKRGSLRLRKYVDQFEGQFPISPDLRYLDMGCGTGQISIALAKLGCRHITGVDFVPRHINSCQAYGRQAGIGDAVQLICEDLNEWVPPEKFDVPLSIEAFEHIDNPEMFLRKMANFIAPGGVAMLYFGPLFHSPFGDHMSPFFRVQIPWRGVIFSDKAILRLRRENFRPTDPVSCYQDVVGGLNLMRYSEFLKYVERTGWELVFLSVNRRLKRLPPLHHVSNMLTRIPVVRDYVAVSVAAILRRSSAGQGKDINR